MQRSQKLRFSLAAACMAALAAAAWADVPRQISYQGRLTGNGDDPVNLQIRFYDAETGGNELFFEEHTGVPRPGGLFSINIGSQTTGGVPDSALDYTSQNPNSEGLWLGVSVWDGSQWVALTPRTPIGMVPYAAKATSAEELVKPDSFEHALSVDADGNVGIGTDDPWSRLSIYSNTPDQSNGMIHLKVTEPFSGSHRILGAEKRNSTNTATLDWWVEVGQGDSPYLGFARAFRPDGEPAGLRWPLFLTWDGQVEIAKELLIDTHDVFEVTFAGDDDANIRHTGGHAIYVHAPIAIPTNAGFEITFTGDNNGNITHENGLDIYVHTPLNVPVLRITGGSDLAEPFAVAGSSDEVHVVQPGMVVVIDADNPGQLKLATEGYDSKVAGVISGAGGVQPGMIMNQEGHPTADGEHPVAMAGKVYVWCDASSGAITPGDLLTTSATPGHAMRADHQRDFPRGCVIGKAMTGLNEGKGLVLMLVQPQ